MSSISRSNSSPEAPGKENLSERSPRTNLLLAATIDAGSLKASVRIRNLSESGALLEGATFPNVDEKLTLRRLDMEIDATVIWHTGSRCGIKFEGRISVAEWALGTWSSGSSGRDQLRVDDIQAAARAGSLPISPSHTNTPPKEIESDLEARVAEELAHLRRLLESMGNALTDEPAIVQRHPKTLQNFDIICQTLGHLENILTAENRGAAANAIGMEDLRARLLRKSMPKGY